MFNTRLSIGLQNRVGPRSRHQESQFSKMSSFLYNIASFLDPLNTQAPFRHKHTQISCPFSSCLFSSFPSEILAIFFFGDEPQLWTSLPKPLFLLGSNPVFYFSPHYLSTSIWGSKLGFLLCFEHALPLLISVSICWKNSPYLCL